MKVTMDVKIMQEAIDLAGRFVSKHATLPILENVYIKGNIDNLIIRASDMEKYIEIDIPTQLEDEGAITVNAKMFSDILKSIDDKKFTLIIDDVKNIMTIQGSSDEFKIKGISASEYVASPQIQDDHPINIATHVFSTGIKKVEYAVTEKNFSPILTGVLVRILTQGDHAYIVFVGTDSFRLAEYRTKISGDMIKDVSLIIPKIHINDIKRVADYCLEKGNEELFLKSSENMISFAFATEHMNITCTSLLIQGNFPDYENENIMPSKRNSKATINARTLEKSIRKISIFTRDINNFMHINGEGDFLTLKSGETDFGEGQTSVPTLIEGKQFSFDINGKYISDFLKIQEGKEIIMRVIDEEKPIVFQEKDDTAYTYIVRPLIK